jgi:hypothetical protein
MFLAHAPDSIGTDRTTSVLQYHLDQHALAAPCPKRSVRWAGCGRPSAWTTSASISPRPVFHLHLGPGGRSPPRRLLHRSI